MDTPLGPLFGYERLGPPRRGLAYLSCLARCYLAGACFNTRGFLNVGLAFAIYPGLTAIHHHDPEALREAKRRYVRHFHTHPFWLPCLVGIFLSAERLIAAGQLPAAMLEKVKNTTSYTLSAIGDSVFAGSVLIFWALASACLLLAGERMAPLLLGVIFFLGLQGFRAYTFWLGLRRGFSVLERIRRWDLINWGQKVKYANGLLLAWLWWLLCPPPVDWRQWAAGAAVVSLFGLASWRRQVPRPVVLAGILGLLAALPWLGQWLREGLTRLTG
ncbi:MAG: PTS system mannose/fructose/sorbose family transporter subunit IID [Desulfovibrionaceae bacterium]